MASKTVSKVVKEYPLPACSQTHEVVKVGDELLMLSQQPSSCVVKMKLEATSGRPLEAKKFLLEGTTPTSGLHGLFASKVNVGKVWATLQFQSQLLLLDPMADDLQATPQVVKSIVLADAPTEAGWGPHTLIETGDGELWVACKGSNYVLRVNPNTSTIVASYPCSSRPIFVALHGSGDVYSGLDSSSKILRLISSGTTPSTFTSKEIDIPSTYGSTPVGLVVGPDANVWFVLLGGSSGGMGTFARISSDGSITYFNLTSTAGATAGLIHLAFDTSYDKTTGGLLRIWLLGSTMASTSSVDAVFCVTMGGDPIRIVSEKTILMPTPCCMSHRVLVHGNDLFVTELGVSILAHVMGEALSSSLISETSDAYSLWGYGSGLDDIQYVEQLSSSAGSVKANKRARKS